jgi:hypothetical protein
MSPGCPCQRETVAVSALHSKAVEQAQRISRENCSYLPQLERKVLPGQIHRSCVQGQPRGYTLIADGNHGITFSLYGIGFLCEYFLINVSRGFTIGPAQAISRGEGSASQDSLSW